jgi:L-ribulose-5-phosphate 4-epimerase
MSFDALKQRVLQANLDLPRLGLVSFTWGNASACDREHGVVVIKPSGVPYETMALDDLVVVDLQGQVIEGQRRPSSDLPTHLQLYRSFPAIAGLVHTHSIWATIWAQAHRAIPALGTTHADYFHGPIPCTRDLTEFQTRGDYERETGRVIVERFESERLDPLEMPAILVASHGPFAWGDTIEAAVHHAAVLEQVARMAFLTLQLDTTLHDMAPYLLEKHFSRKHGPGAYYGQR